MFWVGFLVEVGFIGFGFTVAAGFLAGGVVGWFLLVLTCWFEPVLMVSLASFRNVVVVACRLFLNMLNNSLSSSHFTRRTALGKAGQLTFPLDLREFGSVSTFGRIISFFSGRGVTPPLLMRPGGGGWSPDEQAGPLDPLLGGWGVLASEKFHQALLRMGRLRCFLRIFQE